MPFKTPLVIMSVRGTETYKLVRPLRYYSRELAREFLVPIGVETDFASIPGIVKFWMDDDGGFIRDAAVVHDYLYSVKSNNSYPGITGEAADGILIEGMLDLGASWLKRKAVYYALRLAGTFCYKVDV